jgi:hypothetical protein
MKSHVVAMTLLVGLATLACSIFVGGPDFPEPPVVPSTQSADDAEAAIATAIAESADAGTLKLALSESQLTAYVAAKLAEQPSLAISDPQVLLRDGAIGLYAKAQSGLFVANLRLVAQATVDQSGSPQIEVTQADLGPYPMPAAFTQSISALLQEALTGSLGPAAIGFRLESIEIADGVMTLTGRTK